MLLPSPAAPQEEAAMFRNAEELNNKLFIDGRVLIAALFAGEVDKVVESPRRIDYFRTEYSNIIPVTKCVEASRRTGSV